MWVFFGLLAGFEFAGPVLIILLMVGIAGPFWPAAHRIYEALSWWEFGIVWSLVLLCLGWISSKIMPDTFGDVEPGLFFPLLGLGYWVFIMMRNRVLFTFLGLPVAILICVGIAIFFAIGLFENLEQAHTRKLRIQRERSLQQQPHITDFFRTLHVLRHSKGITGTISIESIKKWVWKHWRRGRDVDVEELWARWIDDNTTLISEEVTDLYVKLNRWFHAWK